MLVLTRKTDETIMIGSDITITILEVRGDSVKIGISAPRSVSVHRGEVVSDVAVENLSAAAASTTPQDLLALLHAAGTAATREDTGTTHKLASGNATE